MVSPFCIYCTKEADEAVRRAGEFYENQQLAIRVLPNVKSGAIVRQPGTLRAKKYQSFYHRLGGERLQHGDTFRT